jgi:hypothetical protein
MPSPMLFLLFCSSSFQSSGDALDPWTGHGTHIAGIVAGNCWYDESNIEPGKNSETILHSLNERKTERAVEHFFSFTSFFFSYFFLFFSFLFFS